MHTRESNQEAEAVARDGWPEWSIRAEKRRGVAVAETQASAWPRELQHEGSLPGAKDTPRAPHDGQRLHSLPRAAPHVLPPSAMDVVTEKRLHSPSENECQRSFFSFLVARLRVSCLAGDSV